MATKRGIRPPLAEYRRKRDFEKTREPAGAATRPGRRRALRFVVQKHAASHLHFDLRLELDGVMKSWAVPKGPSYDPAVRRLAMQVEDHPIEYNTFEGAIPKGEYGGGTVMIWDRGTYEAENGGGEDAVREGYARGDLKIVFDGKRLEGGWVLVRMRSGSPEKPQWLLIKHRDEHADPDRDVVAEAQTSVVTGRRMDEIAEGKRPRKRQPAARQTAKAAKAAKTAKTAKTATGRGTPAGASRKKPGSPRKRPSTRSRS